LLRGLIHREADGAAARPGLLALKVGSEKGEGLLLSGRLLDSCICHFGGGDSGLGLSKLGLGVKKCIGWWLRSGISGFRKEN
jgi:hypothetical protein